MEVKMEGAHSLSLMNTQLAGISTLKIINFELSLLDKQHVM